MLNFTIRRLLLLLLQLVILAVFAFSIVRLAPGDPATKIVGMQAPPEAYEEVREELRLDEPITTQFFHWFGNVIKGDLGKSWILGKPVASVLASRIPRSAWLALLATFFAASIGIPTGAYAGFRQGTILDRIVITASSAFMSIPIFFLGLILMLVFAVKLQWFPVSGYVSPLESTVQSLRHLLLPSLAISSMMIAYLARMTRSSVLEVSQNEYVTTARAKGLPEGLVRIKHIFRPAIVPVLTSLGLVLGGLMGGTIISETIFVVQGTGRLMYTSVLSRDFPIIQAIILFVGAAFFTVNLIVDILYAYANPKIRVD